MSNVGIHSLPPLARENPLDGPSIPPPNGTTSRFDNPPNGNSIGRFVAIFCLVVTTLAVGLRAYTRIFIHKKIHIEDFLGFSGYALFICFVYCIFAIIAGVGVFVHQWDIRVRDMAEELWYIHLGFNFYTTSVMFLKAAILLEWTRLFAPYGISPWFSRTCYTLLVFNILFFSTCIIVSASSCRPYKGTWDRAIPKTCTKTFILDMASSCVNVVLDIAVLVLPQNLIWRLQMTLRRKIGIAIIFGIGLLALISAIYRLVATARFLTSSDKIYAISAVGSACLLEILCVILVFCTPTFPAIVRKHAVLKKAASYLLSRSVFGSKPKEPGNELLTLNAGEMPRSRPQPED
ncbi:hypothetical protein BU24DRAFT_10992 [Aaosphaeria arxii CBS 175.79]|uniref:Rhodopsin domain-containing protein n=1 Tax=Aaosphaeria arxii CBS 175.79 TaxID=1450172 RepID=A0A6A5Y6J9_9PLEO|nr:uncharacterized protein BU24DRAFT_10992 [Aaosphaeria arxii CBS 175.79]KAF2020919.1 hypothetical protein BU24DRAFT_10992 [Aaosphaeria arxii CBS 175.79]